MKTLYIHASLTFGGGVGSVVKNLIEKELINDNLVYLCGPQEDKIKKISNGFAENCKTLILKKNKSFIPNIVRGTNILKIYNELKKNYPMYRVILICHCPGIIGFCGKIPKNTFVVLHGHIYNDGKKITKYFYKKLFSKLSKQCVFVSCSKECGEYYLEHFNLKSRVITNGVSQESKKHVRKGNNFTIGFVGPLWNHKGYQFVIDAIEHIEIRDYHISILFAGVNQDNFDFLSINSDKVFVEYLGLVPDLSKKMSELFDIVVLPSLMEGLPMSLLESISLSIPVLATQVGGIPEIVQDGINGYFIQRDGFDIAQKIMWCADWNNYQKLQKGCEDIYKQGFDSDVMNTQYELLFNEFKLGE